MDVDFTIKSIIKCYHSSRLKLEEYQRGAIDLPKHHLKACRDIVFSLEEMIMSLPDLQQIILFNEIIRKKEGRWYEEFISESTYYRERKKAYKKLLIFALK